MIERYIHPDNRPESARRRTPVTFLCVLQSRRILLEDVYLGAYIFTHLKNASVMLMHEPMAARRHHHAPVYRPVPAGRLGRSHAPPCAQDIYSRDAPFRKYPRNAPTRQYKIYHRLLYPSHFLPFERNASLLRHARYEVQCQPRGCLERRNSCTGSRRVMLSDLRRKSGCCPNWRSCISRLPGG